MERCDRRVDYKKNWNKWEKKIPKKVKKYEKVSICVVSLNLLDNVCFEILFHLEHVQ